MKHRLLFAFTLLIANLENIDGMSSLPSSRTEHSSSPRLTSESPGMQLNEFPPYPLGSFSNSPDISDTFGTLPQISSPTFLNPDSSPESPTMRLPNSLTLTSLPPRFIELPGSPTQYSPVLPFSSFSGIPTSPLDTISSPSISFDISLPTTPFPPSLDFLELIHQNQEQQSRIEELEAKLMETQEILKKERRAAQKRSERKNLELKKKNKKISEQQKIIDNQAAAIRRLQQQNAKLRQNFVFQSQIQKQSKSSITAIFVEQVPKKQKK